MVGKPFDRRMFRVALKCAWALAKAGKPGAIERQVATAAASASTPSAAAWISARRAHRINSASAWRGIHGDGHTAIVTNRLYLASA
jgi:hypothetical protein